MLVGTTSVELSEHLSTRLRAEPLRKLAQVYLLRQAWMEKNNRQEDGRLIDELQPLNEPLDQLQVPEMRKMARELGISFNPEDPENLPRLLEILDLSASDAERLKADLQCRYRSPGVERPQAHRRIPDHCRGGCFRCRDHRHQHGWAWCRYQAGRRAG